MNTNEAPVTISAQLAEILDIVADSIDMASWKVTPNQWEGVDIRAARSTAAGIVRITSEDGVMFTVIALKSNGVCEGRMEFTGKFARPYFVAGTVAELLI